MRKYFVLTLIFITTIGFAQVNVGNLQRPDSRSSGGELRRNDVRSLERTKLIFFIGEKDNKFLEEYKNVLSEAWNLTEVEFDSIGNLNQYERARNISFLKLEMDPVVEIHPNLGTEKTIAYQVYYHLYIPGNRGPETMARIELFLDYEDQKKLLEFERDDERLSWLYNNADFYNWNPGFMKIYFSQIHKLLKNESTLGLYDELEEQDSVSVLMETTLYAPDYILAAKDPRSGEVSYRPAVELFDDYPFEYTVIKTAELGDKILNSEEEMFFLLFTLSGEEKHVSVYNSRGNLLYHHFSGNSYMLDDKDLKRLAKTID